LREEGMAIDLKFVEDGRSSSEAILKHSGSWIPKFHISLFKFKRDYRPTYISHSVKDLLDGYS